MFAAAMEGYPNQGLQIVKAVFTYFVKINQLSVGIVNNFYLAGLLGKVNGRAAYERLRIQRVRWNKRQYFTY